MKIYLYKKWTQILLVVLLFSSCFNYVNAKEIHFKISAPEEIEKDKPFRICFILQNAETDEKQDSIQLLPSVKGLKILYGPAKSSSLSITIKDGIETSSSSESYTYTLLAESEGLFTIPATTIKANGMILKSDSVEIKVLPPTDNAEYQYFEKTDNDSNDFGGFFFFLIFTALVSVVPFFIGVVITCIGFVKKKKPLKLAGVVVSITSAQLFVFLFIFFIIDYWVT